MKNTNKTTYDDILHLPHHVSAKRPQMSLHDRAAQFAPFAALTGHEDAVKETARLTEAKIELDENEIELLDQKLRYIAAQKEPPTVEITYFLPDQRKNGGSYVETNGKVKRIHQNEQILCMEDGTRIPIEDILRIKLEIKP